MRRIFAKIVFVIPSLRRSPPPAPAPEPPRLPALAQRRPAGCRPVRVLSLATATREYARRLDAGIFDTARPADLAPLAEAMGPEIWGWQHARRLTGQAPWRARPHVDERRERLAVAYAMTADIDTWERALALHDGLVERAHRLRDPPPPALAVPPEVRAALDERWRAALERAGRRQRRTEAQGGGPEPVPEEGVRHIPLPSKPV